MTTLIKFPVISFRRIESPYDNIGEKDYMTVLNIKDLPEELEDWREVNVRDSRLTSGVAKKIAETLRDNPDSFFFKNRGITLIVDRIGFDSKSNSATIEMNDKQRNGLLDGGHTYSVIKKFLGDLSEEELKDVNAFVKMEVLEGIKDPEDVVAIVEARNTSTQVREQSIEELRKRYEEIKEVLSSENYASRIAYKEYELLEDGTRKDIDIKEILSYLVCFDAEEFEGNNHPIRAYSTKSAIVGYFKDNRKRLGKYLPLLPKILKLRDVIYLELPGAYNSSGGKFGALTGVTEVSSRRRMSNTVLPFISGEESSYRIPSGFIYPVLAAFRNLVRCGGNNCEWKTDPVELFKEIKIELANRVCDQAKELRNPNKLGKDKATWGRCYDLVKLEVLERKL